MQHTPTQDPETEESIRTVMMATKAPALFKGIISDRSSIHDALNKAVRTNNSISGQTAQEGRVLHPFNMELADRLVEVNPHHSTCLQTAVAGTMGGGLGVTKKQRGPEVGPHAPPEIDEDATLELHDALDDLCEQSFWHEYGQTTSNYWGVGTGYLEVSRNDSGVIDGLYWMPSPSVHKVLASKTDRRQFFYEAYGDDGQPNYFAPFGRVNEARTWMQNGLVTPVRVPDRLTELIPFLQPTTRWEHYGAPHWGAAGAHIEVDARSLQRISDYMQNGGMPEQLLTFTGFAPTDSQVNDIRNVLGGSHGRHIGGSAALFFKQARKTTSEINLFKLGNDLDHEGYSSLHETINLAIATAWQVPPVLAGISTPGKMAAANEQVLAMVTMQRSLLDRAQRLHQSMLRKTLFNSVHGIRGFAGKRVRFRTWLESTDIQSLNVVARQRESVAENPKRDPKEGLKR